MLGTHISGCDISTSSTVAIATGSVGTLGKTAATVILVDKANPIAGLTLAQLDAKSEELAWQGRRIFVGG